jgi:hypothetical protein
MPIRSIQFIRSLVALSLVLLLSWAAYYYYHIGFGRHWRAMLAKEFQAFGLQIRVRRLTLDPVRGLVAKDLEIWDSGRRQMIVAQISDLSLDINYANLFQQEPALNAVDLHDAKISIPIDPSEPRARRVQITGFQARIYFFPGRIEVRQASGLLYGIHLQVSGTLVNPGAFALPVAQPSRAQPGKSPEQKFINLLVSEIHKTRFPGTSPELDLTFQVDLAAPASLRLEAGHLFARGLKRENYRLQNLDCRFSLERQKFSLERLYARDTRGELFAKGTWNLASGERNFQIRSGLDAAKLLANEPRFPWARELMFDGPLEIEISCSAEHNGQLQILGKLNFDEFSFRNVKFQSMRAEFSKSGHSWMVLNAQLTHRSGTLTADVLNRPGYFRIRFNSALNPIELAPLWPTKFQNVLREWEFQTPPVVQGTFFGASRAIASLFGSGQAWLGKTRFRGTLMNSASANFELRNDVLNFKQVSVARDEGSGTGQFAWDLRQDQISIEAVAAKLSPGAMIAWVDPKVAKYFQPFRFAGTPDLRATGSVNLADGLSYDLRVEIATADPCTFEMGSNDIPVTKGSADIHFSGSNSRHPALNGSIAAHGATISTSKFFAPLLAQLRRYGFGEPLDINLNFRFDPQSVQLESLQLFSKSRETALSGKIYLPSGIVDLNGNTSNGYIGVRAFGTVQNPTWELILPVAR